MQNEIDHIARLLEGTFEANAWHGPSVKEAIHGVTEREALYRLPGTHNIIELIAHMTAWRHYVIKKLQGDATYRVSDEANFPSENNWSKVAAELEESQRQLLHALQQFPAGNIYSQVPGKTQPLTYYALLHSIIHHDLYHTGQVVLIRKTIAAQTI